MAPPSNRRSSFSRRAQYTTFFVYVAAVLGALVGGALLILSLSDPPRFAAARGAATDVTEPVAVAAASARKESRGFFETIAGFFTSGRENARLRREVTQARVKLVEAQATAEENRRLKALLDLTLQDPRPVATAMMIGSTSASSRRFATISAGADKGVAIGMPVRSPLGLLGRVLEVGSSTARILLITDTESVVPVRRATDGVPAFATGRGDGTLQVRLINLGINPLKVGDVLVTSGSGGLYRPGTPVAMIGRLLPDGGIARVLSDPGVTEFVVVESTWNPDVEAFANSRTAPGERQPSSSDQ